jgi:hypothetical protein
MSSNKKDLPFIAAYFLLLAIQLPIWLCAGMLWATLMVVFSGSTPDGAFIGGLGWGFCMWLVMGNLCAIGFAWRRTTELPVTNRLTFRTALEQVCNKLRLKVLRESADKVVLGTKRALVRFKQVEVRLEFLDDTVELSAPALSFGRVRNALEKALSEADTSSSQP